MNDKKSIIPESEFIDSVQEIKMNIRSHKDDDEFEKMFAELNGNGSKEKKPASAPAAEPAPAKTGHTAIPAFAEIKEDNNTAPVKQPSEKRRPNNAAKPAAEQKPAVQSRSAVPQKKPQLKPEKPKSKPIFENVDSVWDNPALSDGGRISMNIKTDFRKEFSVTLPVKPAEPAKPVRKEPEIIFSDRVLPPPNIPKTPKLPKDTIEFDPHGDRVIPAPMHPQRKKTNNGSADKIESPKKHGDPKNRSAKAAVKAHKEELTAQKVGAVNKRFAIINVIVCLTLFFGIGLFLLLCERKSGFIDSENRNLAEKPELTVQSLIDGSYFEDITKWYTDTIPGREELKPFSSRFAKLFGITLNDVKIKGDLAPVKKEELGDDVTVPDVKVNTDFSSTQTSRVTRKTNSSEKLAEVPDELDEGEWMGNVVVSGKGENVRAMSAFYGEFSMGAKYAETINRYREELGSSVNIYTMNMPSAAAYYMPENLADQFTSQKDCITNIGSNLLGIVNVDVYDELDAHKEEYIYSRTDHHWAPRGAYYAAKVFAQKAAVLFPDLSEYEECKIDNFVGTMYAYSDYDEELNQNPDTFYYYKPDNDYTVNYYDSTFSNPNYNAGLFFDYTSGVNCYSAILGRDDVIAEIETDSDNGRVLVIFKDSFGNALVPYLTHGFSKIYVCDFRYFDINAIDFCYDVGCTDLLFAVSISAAHTESHINAIGNLRIQHPEAEEDLPEPYIPDRNALPQDSESNGDDTNDPDTEW